MSELPLDDEPGISAAARDAARGHVVYLTEPGERQVAARIKIATEALRKTPGQVA
jgi:hypothetical protein